MSEAGGQERRPAARAGRRQYVILGVAAALLVAYLVGDMVMARRLLIGGGGASFTAPAQLGSVFELTTAPAGGWSTPQYPKAVYANGKSYVGYVNGDGGLYVAQYDHATEAVATFLLDTPSPTDDHDNPAVIVRDDGRILTAFTKHNGPNMFVRLSTNPGDISAFGAAINTDAGWSGMTYPALAQLTGVTGDPIYLLTRDSPSPGVTGRLAMSKSTDGGATWSTREIVLSGIGERFPYWAITSDETTIHVMTTDRDPYGSEGSPVTVGHMYFDGSTETWHGSDGTAIGGGMPFDITDLTEVYDGGDGPTFVMDGMLVGGVPRFTYIVDTGSSMLSARYARWSGTEWLSSEIYTAAHHPLDRYYGSAAINKSTPTEVFAGIKVGSVSELHRFLSPDDGASWAAGDPITSGSPDLNAAPLGVVNGDPSLPVVWLRGTIESSFVFDFGIAGLRR